MPQYYNPWKHCQWPSEHGGLKAITFLMWIDGVGWVYLVSSNTSFKSMLYFDYYCSKQLLALDLGPIVSLLLFVPCHGTRWHSCMYNYESMRELRINETEISGSIICLSYLKLTILMCILQSSQKYKPEFHLPIRVSNSN